MKQNIQRFALGSFLTLLAVQFSGCSASQGIEPSRATCNQFFVQMQSNQLNTAHTLLSSKAKGVTSPKQLQQLWSSVESRKGKVQSWAETGGRFFTDSSGSKVTIGYDVKCVKGNGDMTFDCVEENGKWLIQSFEINI